MTIPEILKELELYKGRFPMQAMQAVLVASAPTTIDRMPLLVAETTL
jgi:hypothetical protein